MGIITARVLDPEGKGVFGLLVLLPSTIALIGSLGIRISNVFFIGKRKERKKESFSL
ncbi:MAG: hypothetical protein QMD71_04070 [bacterium]|nr:hypothetical protein [bacterium]